MTHNAGLRSLAKLLLNSFWGKFGQRQNLTKTQFLHDSDAHVLFRHMADPTVEVMDFQIVDDLNLMLSTQRVSYLLGATATLRVARSFTETRAVLGHGFRDLYVTRRRVATSLG